MGPGQDIETEKPSQLTRKENFKFEYKYFKNLINAYHITFLKSRSFHFLKNYLLNLFSDVHFRKINFCYHKTSPNGRSENLNFFKKSEKYIECLPLTVFKI